jgi:hypothetical protein
VLFCFEVKHSIWNNDDHQISINSNLIKLLVDDDVATPLCMTSSTWKTFTLI